MTTKTFPQSNVVFKNKENSVNIPAWRGKDTNGKECTVTYWEITPDELNQMLINNRVGIFITTEGHSSPMIGVQTTSPFGEEPKKARIINLGTSQQN